MKTGTWALEQEVGTGGMVPALTSIFIYHRFLGKNYMENRPGAGSALHTRAAL